MNLSKMEFVLLKQLHLQPSELDRLEFYRMEYMIDHFKEWIAEEKKQQDAEDRKHQKEMGSMTSWRKDFDSMRNSSSSSYKPPNFKI